MVGMVVGGERVLAMHGTLTVEPDFKSSGLMTDDLLTIGEVGARVGVGHLRDPLLRDAEGWCRPTPGCRASAATGPRQSGDSCSSACSKTPDSASTRSTASSTPATVEEWKAIARRSPGRARRRDRTPPRARAYLEGALLCRYDHPATDCRIMGAEIDRRLAQA